MDNHKQTFETIRTVFNKMTWLNKIKMEESLKGYTPSEVHCIEYIEKHKDPNVTQLGEAFFMTRSAISKMTKRLINKGIIESYQKTDNKKEVYFRLTEKGRALNEIHERLHQEFYERDKVIFDQVSAEQYEKVMHFLQEYNKHLDEEMIKWSNNPTVE
ncbi:MarR family transcriptional regulator [Gorillibacterium sp. CAU 1737]|uniref:MarR family transcriptional regulator n=1 Tax=Gorillibacterium sp. CAU 1737 TaxID=3140362 RepID=UPI003260FEE5